MTIPPPAVATVLAALIAATITFLVAVFAKESKTSEFRQNWIDGLRSDLSKFVSLQIHLASEYGRRLDQAQDETTSAFWQRINPQLLDMEEIQSRIELRLNPEEHVKLIVMVRDLTKLSVFTKLPDNEQAQLINHFIAESQRVLKTEWEVVKKGEPTYRWVKRFALFLAATALAAMLVLAYQSVGAAP